MKVRKNKSKQLSISEVDKTYVIVALFENEWHIMQAESYESDAYLLLPLGVEVGGCDLTCKNARSSESMEYWFEICQEMHAFKTTKAAFKFLIKVL